jgi:cold shock CspA family protein
MPEVSALQAGEETEFTLTFQQPWATLIAIGAKQYEGAVLPPDASMIGKRIAIMAATNRAGDHCRMRSNAEAAVNEALCRAGIRNLPHGTIVGTAVLRAAWHAKNGVSKRRRIELDDEVGGSTLARPRHITLSPLELLFGDFRGGCWLWRFEDHLLPPSEWREGRVKSFGDRRGFGFIRYGNRDVYFHLNTLMRAGLSHVLPEQPIEFQCEHGPKGLRATAVKLPLDLTRVAA